MKSKSKRRTRRIIGAVLLTAVLGGTAAACSAQASQPAPTEDALSRPRYLR